MRYNVTIQILNLDLEDLTDLLKIVREEMGYFEEETGDVLAIETVKKSG